MQLNVAYFYSTCHSALAAESVDVLQYISFYYEFPLLGEARGGFAFLPFHFK
jgi:hypothetical protein